MRILALPMIGTIKGIVEYKEDPHLIVDVNGVGYALLVPTTVSAKITSIGESIKLYTHTHVREDALELFGFTEHEDLKLFKYLIDVSGVGCKTALNVFSVGSRKDIVNAIATNNVTFFTGVPRLGKKNAQKIIIELKNKIGGEDFDLSQEGAEQQDIITVLKSFGFTAQESQAALRELNGAGNTVEEKIKLALKYLGK